MNTTHKITSLGMIASDIPKPDLFLGLSDLDTDDRCADTSQPLDGLGRILPKELADLITGAKESKYDEIMMFDCRFRYEFDAGHIIGARSLTTFDQLKHMFDRKKGSNCLVVFHCEFSRNRGPTFAAGFREHDRAVNLSQYPLLSFPNVAILEGGFKRFYSEYPSLCTGRYLPMRDPMVDRESLRRGHSQFVAQQKIMRSISAQDVRVQKKHVTIRESHSQPIYPIFSFI